MMRSSSTLLVLVAALVAAAGASFALSGDVQTVEQDVDSRDVTCDSGDERTCDAPSARARFEAGGASLDAQEPDHEQCLSKLVDDGETNDPACQAGDPTVDAGVFRVYYGLDGLPEDEGMSSEGDEAAPAPSAEDGEGLSATAQAAILMGALGVTAAAGGVTAFGLRRFVTLLLAPLAARLEPSKLLDDDTRQRIYETVRAEPGINLRGLADELELAWGTLLHHLHKMEKAHLVVSRRYGKYRRYFINGSTYSKEEQARLAALSTPSTARVAEYILEHPGATQAQVGEALGVTPSTVLWHARRLKKVGLVEQVREGRYVKYFAQLSQDEQSQMAAA